MKNLIFKTCTILLLLMSCDNLKRQSYFPFTCNENFKYLQIEKYIYPISYHKVYIEDSLKNKYFLFEYDEDGNNYYDTCFKDTICIIKESYSYINDSITRYKDEEKLYFIISKKTIIREKPSLNERDINRNQRKKTK